MPSMLRVIMGIYYLIVVLIGIDLIIIAVDYLSMCFYYLILCEYSLSLETGLLNLGPVWNSLLIKCTRIFLEGRCHLKPCQTCDYLEPFSTCFMASLLTLW